MTESTMPVAEQNPEGDRPARGDRFLLRHLVWLFGLWTLPGLLYSVQIHQIGSRLESTRTSFFDAMLHALPVWWFWVPATLLLVKVARRFPIRSRGALKQVLIHLLISVLVALVVVTLAALWLSSTPPFHDRDRPWLDWTMDLMLSTTLHLYFWCYWLIIAAVHFFDHERRLREQEVRAARLDALAAESRMQMLVSQLRPHFLFNALNGLSTLILKGDRQEAQSMLSSLAELLRASMRVGETSLVPLQEELEVADRYLEVEKVRWGDRLAVRTEIAPGVEEARVPALLLQPLLENAIRHGIGKSESGGEVLLSGSMQGGKLRLRVENDGIGIAEQSRLNADRQLGLANTRARLELLFGDDHDFDLVELDGGRVRVDVVLPFWTDTATAGASAAGDREGVQ